MNVDKHTVQRCQPIPSIDPTQSSSPTSKRRRSWISPTWMRIVSELVSGMRNLPVSIVGVSDTAAAVDVSSKAVEATLFREADAHGLRARRQRGNDDGHVHIYHTAYLKCLLSDNRDFRLVTCHFNEAWRACRRHGSREEQMNMNRWKMKRQCPLKRKASSDHPTIRLARLAPTHKSALLTFFKRSSGVPCI